MSGHGRKPRLVLRISSGLRRLGAGTWRRPKGPTPDRAWHDLLSRLDAEEAERRLDAMAAALDERARR